MKGYDHGETNIFNFFFLDAKGI